MFALVDCNSFFCSVERVFHPGLRGRPVCVLSSNDGIIVALTPEAKALGLHRGDPLFKVQSIVERHKVAVFSSNMMLYAAMSRRIVNILRESVSNVENYSIDESFCDLSGYEQHYDLTEYMRSVAEKISLYTDIPVSVGIAPTKTLAKIGSKFAKNFAAYRGVCTIDTEAKRRKALELTALSDVWGIGRSAYKELCRSRVSTALEFADKSEEWVRRHFHKPMIQTWLELNGQPCISTMEHSQKQTICTSRSFGEMVSDYDSLSAAVSHFAASCANKLRAQESVAKQVSVFVGTNPFRTDLEQYGNYATTILNTASSDTIELTIAALDALKGIFKDGVMYKRAGVVLSEISSSKYIIRDLFDQTPDRAELMKSIDEINQRYGTKTIHLLSEGLASSQKWKVKREHSSPNYLTDVNELLVVRDD